MTLDQFRNRIYELRSELGDETIVYVEDEQGEVHEVESVELDLGVVVIRVNPQVADV